MSVSPAIATAPGEAALAAELASVPPSPRLSQPTWRGRDSTPRRWTPESVGIAGDPDRVRERLLDYGHAAIDELVVRPVPVGDAGVAAAVVATAPLA